MISQVPMDSEVETRLARIETKVDNLVQAMSDLVRMEERVQSQKEDINRIGNSVREVKKEVDGLRTDVYAMQIESSTRSNQSRIMERIIWTLVVAALSVLGLGPDILSGATDIIVPTGE